MTDPASLVCADYQSAFDCFVAEKLQALVGVILAVGVPLGLVLWRWYQQRALDRIMAAAERDRRA